MSIFKYNDRVRVIRPANTVGLKLGKIYRVAAVIRTGSKVNSNHSYINDGNDLVVNQDQLILFGDDPEFPYLWDASRFEKV